jgi:signal transduction histidine kinase
MSTHVHFIDNETAVVRDRDGARELRTEDFTAPVQEIFGDASNMVLTVDDEDQVWWLLSRIRETLGFSHAFVGELAGADWNLVDVVAVDTQSGRGDCFTYELAYTPCEDVMTMSACVFPRHVAQLFPDDHLLEEMGIECYVGLPLFDAGGRPLGLIVLLNQREVSDGIGARAVVSLRAVRDKVASILQLRRHQRDVEGLVRSTLSSGGRDALQTLIEDMCSCLMTRGGFVCSMSSVGGKTQAGVMQSTVADITIDAEVWALLDEGLNVPLVVKGGVSLSTDDRVEQCDSMLLIPLFGGDDRVIGLAGLWHDRPLNPRLEQRPIVQAYRERMSLVLQEWMYEQGRHATERRMHELERVESIGMLAGGIAHDFNNILVGVLGNADYLLHSQNMNQIGDLRETIQDIRDAAVSANELCKQLMSYASRSSIESQVFNLGAEVEEVGRLAKTTLGVACSFELHISSTPVLVMGDPLQLRQVVLNLVTNARDAVDDDGLVSVSVQPTHMVEPMILNPKEPPLSPGSYAILTVSDNGRGMSEHVLHRIFDPFFSTKQHGYGLGLACVRDTLHAHQGRIEVASTPHVGTSFIMYIPLAVQGASSGISMGRSMTPTTHPDTLLLVDDDERIRKTLRRLASRAGYDVIEAAGGLEGLRLYLEHQHDISLVILDLSMPGMDGYETLKRLRLIDPDVRVLISSGNREAKVDAPLLAKPYSFNAFDRLVSKTIRPKSSVAL